MIRNITYLGAALLLIFACSDDEKVPPATTLSGDHVWKEQTQTIDRAKEVEGLLQDTADKQREAIEEQIQ